MMKISNKIKVTLVFVCCAIVASSLLFSVETAAQQGISPNTWASVNNQQPVSVLKFVILNSQSTNTVANFTQMVTVNSLANSQLYASNLKNVNWQDGNGTVLSSWLESGASNTATNSVYWVKLPSAVAGNGGTFEIYQCIYDTSLSAVDGIATGVSANAGFGGSYGQYNNGASVFEAYWNFAGSSLPTDWTNNFLGWGYGTTTVNNGVTITGGTNNWQAIGAKSTYNPTVCTLDMYLKFNGLHGGSVPYRIAGFNAMTTSACLLSDYASSTAFCLENYGSGPAATTIAGGSVNNMQLWSVYEGSSASTLTLNYGTSVTQSTQFVSSTSKYVSASVANSGVAMTIGFFRLRLDAPNNVMPSVSTGAMPLSSLYNAGYTDGWTTGNATGYENGYNNGWNVGNATGYSNGYAAGWTDGWNAGYSAGWNAGNATGYTNGWSAGNIVGYNNGWAAGWSAGYTAGWNDLSTQISNILNGPHTPPTPPAPPS